MQARPIGPSLVPGFRPYSGLLAWPSRTPTRVVPWDPLS